MRHPATLVLAAALSLAVLTSGLGGVAPPAAAQPAPQIDPRNALAGMGAPPGEAAPDAEREAWWRRRAALARERVAAARERLAAAEAAYPNLRQRDHLRGEPRQRIVAEREAAAAELEAALRYLEEELPEEARRAGALPGWVRPPPGR